MSTRSSPVPAFGLGPAKLHDHDLAQAGQAAAEGQEAMQGGGILHDGDVAVPVAEDVLDFPVRHAGSQRARRRRRSR